MGSTRTPLGAGVYTCGTPQVYQGTAPRTVRQLEVGSLPNDNRSHTSHTSHLTSALASDDVKCVRAGTLRLRDCIRIASDAGESI
jgi:hypothetical protein